MLTAEGRIGFAPVVCPQKLWKLLLIIMPNTNARGFSLEELM